MRLELKSNPVSEEMLIQTKKAVTIESDLWGNSLLITSRTCGNSDKLTYFTNGNAIEIPSSYAGISQRAYLINLQKIQPDSVRTCGGSLVFHFKDVIPSETSYTYYSDWAEVQFPENSLYDTLFLNTNHRIENRKEIFVIGQRIVPLHKPVQIILKPSIPLPANKNLAVYKKEGNSVSYLGGEWSGSKVKFHYTRTGHVCIPSGQHSLRSSPK